MELIQARKVLFLMFGLAFFLSRIVLLPLTIMKIGFIDAFKEDYETFGKDLLVLGNLMILVLYILQVFWMAKIVKVLRAGKTGSTPTKSDAQKTAFSETRPLNGKSKEN